MGGTMARMVTLGIRLTVVYVTPGGRSPRTSQVTDQEMAVMRRRESIRASREIIGVESAEFIGLEYPRTPGEQGPWSEAVESRLAKLVSGLQPREVYVPHPGETHPTHRAVTAAAQASASSAQLRPSVYGYEIWAPIAAPDRYEDITPFEGLKRQAIRAHETQTADKDYEEGVMGLNRYRAVFSTNHPDQARYVEAFVTLAEGEQQAGRRN